MSYELEFTQDMGIHDVVHVSRLRPYKKRENEIGNPPALMPGGHVEFEVEEILTHVDDADNLRWYSARFSDGTVEWLTEADARNCLDRVKEYFAKAGISARRPARASKRGRKKSSKTRIQPETEKQGVELEDSVKESQPLARANLRRSSRIQQLMFLFRDDGKSDDSIAAYEYGKSFPSLY